MTVSRWGAIAAGGTAVALIAGATLVAAPAYASSHGRKATKYTISAKGAVTGAGKLKPGRVVIQVKGHKGEDLQLVKARHGAGKATLIADGAALNTQQDPGPIERDFQLVGGAPVGSTLYVTLKRGTYYAIDTDNEKPTAAAIRKITVTGKKVNAAKPKTTGTITAIKSESWAKKPKQIKHKGVLAFDNKASQPHFIVLIRLRAGKTVKDIKAALEGKEDPSKVLYTESKYSTASGALSPHTSLKFSYNLHKGNYGLLCFWPDAKTHMPHALMGMIRTIKLT